MYNHNFFFTWCCFVDVELTLQSATMTLVKLLITLIGGLVFISVVEACAPLEFRCGNGQCVPASWKCDGEQDCTDGIDETADECAASRTCNPLHFTCGNSRCIPKTWMCDGTDDCGDNTDESSCPSGPPTCDVAQFQCGSECVPVAWVCDGEIDCVNRHDEANCSNPTPSSACHDSEFRCRNGDCINVLWACDGDSDCRDHSDEMNCTLPTTCQPYEFTCVNSNADGTRCIPINLKCDGLRQCEDGSDEVGCSAVNCSLTEFQCAFNKRLTCISVDKVCDHSRDCPDGDDEVWTPGGLCNQSTPHLCDRDNGGCSQLCNRRPVGPLCLCRTGYQLDAADNSTCTDVDECASPELCSHICRNTPGSYTCTCHRGYEMDPSQSYCKVSGMSPRIILANRHNIRQYNLNGREYSTLINRSRSAIAIDYDYSRSNLFYSDVAIETIYLVEIQFNFQVGRSSELVVNLRNVDGVAYDWVHRNLYWTDTGTDTISVLSNYTGTRYRKILIKEKLDEPRAIVVDPREDQRWMYWSDWGSVSKIEKAGLDGSNRKSIVTQNIQWPNGITIDFISNRIFWVDAKLKEIGSCDLNGGNYKLVAYSNQYLAHPFSIDVFEDFVYWTDWETNSILKANKFSGKKIDTVLNGLSAPMGLKIYHEVKQQNATNACGTNNGRCSHICLPLPNSNDSHSEMLNHTCTCPDIVPMGETCYMEPLIPTENPSTTRAGMEVTTWNIAEDTSAVTKVTSSATLVHTTIVSSDETTTNSGTTGKSLEITTGSDVIGTTSVGDFVPGHKNTRSSKLIIIIVMVLLALVLVAALVAVYVWYRFYYLKNSSKGLTYMFDNPHYIPDNESKELLVDISPGLNSV